MFAGGRDLPNPLADYRSAIGSIQLGINDYFLLSNQFMNCRFGVRDFL